MRIEERACLARGYVRPSFVDISTGKRMPFRTRSNKLSYTSAEAMAAAFGGDPSYIPSRIGFIYGNKEAMPTESVITRDQSWNQLVEELDSSGDSANVDVQVVGFSYHPTLGAEEPAPVSGDSSSYGSSSSSGSSSGSDSGSDSSQDEESDYNNILPTGSNAITFHAVSNSHDIGSALSKDPFQAGNYIYQAVLLGYHGARYYILSRVSLKDGDSYLRKPDGFEVALDWTVAFR